MRRKVNVVEQWKVTPKDGDGGWGIPYFRFRWVIHPNTFFGNTLEVCTHWEKNYRVFAVQTNKNDPYMIAALLFSLGHISGTFNTMPCDWKKLFDLCGLSLEREYGK